MDKNEYVQLLKKARSSLPEQVFEKSRFAKWNHSEMPEWYRKAISAQDPEQVLKEII